MPDQLNLNDPATRRRALRQFLWMDHAVLRLFWTNFFEIAPGVFRSNQPSHARFQKIAAQGIKTVINLRGADMNRPSYAFEKESCDAFGLDLIDLPMNARTAPDPDAIRSLLHLFRTLKDPYVFHCKSGADRSGLAAALYLIVMQGETVAEAKRMLSWRYVHLSWTKTGILGDFLDSYAARNARAPIAFEAWLDTEYDPKLLAESFTNGRKLPK